MASPRRCRTISLDVVRGLRVPRTLMMIMALLLGSARGQQQCEDTCLHLKCGRHGRDTSSERVARLHFPYGKEV